MAHRDISLDEQQNVRVCLRALRARFNTWYTIERALPISHSVLVDLMAERREVSVTIAFRVAKMLDVSLYDVLAGTAVTPGTCHHCGKEPSEHWRCAGEAG
jgi:hypothetical protein